MIKEAYSFTILIAKYFLINEIVKIRGFSIFHWYLISHSISKFDSFLISAICLYIAQKTKEYFYIPLDLFLKKVFEEIGVKRNLKIEVNERFIELKKEEFYNLEFEILKSIGFNLNMEIPIAYIELLKPLIDYNSYENALVICSGIYYFPLCLMYHPLELACYCVEMAISILEDNHDLLKWNESSSRLNNFQAIEEIKGICYQYKLNLIP